MNSASNNPARNTKIMNRFDLTSRLIAKLKNEEAVVGGIGNTNFDLWAAGHRPQNFYMLGSMGLAFPIALGVALAQPNRRIFALEGDGSLLMQLGSLATIATLAPKNLTMVVMDNGVYQITGAQPTPAAAVSDIVAIAVASGLTDSVWAADEDDFERLIEQSMSASAPTLIGVRIDDKPGVGTTRRNPCRSGSVSCTVWACESRYKSDVKYESDVKNPRGQTPRGFSSEGTLGKYYRR